MAVASTLDARSVAVLSDAEIDAFVRRLEEVLARTDFDVFVARLEELIDRAEQKKG